MQVWIDINVEIQAFMTFSVTHYTIVTAFKNILPTSPYSSENYCFMTKPQPYKSSWYIIHANTGFCAFFPLADLPGVLQGDPFTRRKAKLCFSPLLLDKKLWVGASVQSSVTVWTCTGPRCTAIFLSACREWQTAAAFISTCVYH